MRERRAFLLFVGVGGLAATINFGARVGLQRVMSFEAAVVLAYLIGMTVAFVLNRAFVFDADGDWRRQYVRFVIVNLVALAQVFLVTVGLARLTFPALGLIWHPEAVAHLIGLASPIMTSYWGHKYFSFATRRGAAGVAA